jgi:hypothetical protein
VATIAPPPPRTITPVNAPAATGSIKPARSARIEEPSRALPIARPWPLIIAVLAIDLALAIAGAWMLRTGLASPTHPPAAAPPASKAP